MYKACSATIALTLPRLPLRLLSCFKPLCVCVMFLAGIQGCIIELAGHDQKGLQQDLFRSTADM